MPTKKITAPGFSLRSTWRCVLMTKQTNAGYQFENSNMPTMSSNTVNFNYSLPSGAKIKKAQVWATPGSPLTGASLRLVNNKGMKLTKGAERGVDVTLSGTSGTFRAEFVFKANGNKQDTLNHTSSLTFSNVYLLIEYSGGEKKEEKKKDKEKTKKGEYYPVPPQSVCLYDETNNAVYLFDGVTKIQHSISVKLEEEPEKKKDEYVNNARNEPDKVSLDVMMSDVHSSGGANTANGYKLNDSQSKAFKAAKSGLIDMRDSRSTLAYQTFHWLKEQRRKLTLITPQYIYVDMIITGLTTSQDETCPFGWMGQMTLQTGYQTSEQQKNIRGSNIRTEVQPPSPSLHSGLIRW